jgi:hypothetical protein
MTSHSKSLQYGSKAKKKLGGEMARGNDNFPSWMTVLKDPPVNTEDPLLAWVRRIGRDVAKSRVTDFLSDIGAGAAGGAAAQYLQNLSPDNEAAAKAIGGAANSGVQSAFKWAVDQMRGRPNAKPTEDQIRKIIDEKVERDARVRELMRTYGVPGY